MLPEVQRTLAENFRVLANNLNKSAKYFRVAKNSQGEKVLKTNGCVRRIFSCGATHEKKVAKFINKKVSTVEQLERSCFLNDKGEYNFLFDSLQKYNQSLQRHQDLGINSSFVGKLEILERDDIKDFNPVTINLSKPQANHHDELAKDKPEIYQERRFSFTHFFSKRNIKLYPTDKTADGTPIVHSEEAKKIFFSTQIERLLSLIGRICQCP